MRGLLWIELTSASLEPNMRNFLRLSTLLTLRRTLTLASRRSSKVSTSSSEMSSIMLLFTPTVPGDEALEIVLFRNLELMMKMYNF